MKTHIMLAAAASLLLASQSAAQLYDCNMTSQGSGGWVGERMIFDVDRSNASVLVMDAIVNEAYDAPIEAEAEKRSDILWRLKWKVEGIKASNGGDAKLQYCALLNLKTDRLSLNGVNKGYDNVILGAGRCAPYKG